MRSDLCKHINSILKRRSNLLQSAKVARVCWPMSTQKPREPWRNWFQNSHNNLLQELCKDTLEGINKRHNLTQLKIMSKWSRNREIYNSRAYHWKLLKSYRWSQRESSQKKSLVYYQIWLIHHSNENIEVRYAITNYLILLNSKHKL